MSWFHVLTLGIAAPGAAMILVEATFADPKWRPVPAVVGALLCAGLAIYDLVCAGPSPWPRVAAAVLSGIWLNSFFRIRKRVV